MIALSLVFLQMMNIVCLQYQRGWSKCPGNPGGGLCNQSIWRGLGHVASGHTCTENIDINFQRKSSIKKSGLKTGFFNAFTDQALMTLKEYKNFLLL